MLKFSLALAAWTLLAISLTPAADWPRFRGPNGTGVASDKDIPIEWTAKDFKWKTPIPGIGNSSPIVSKGLIFLQSASDDQSKRFMICVDAGTGAIKWNKEFKGGRVKAHMLNSPASSTPVADGERIYAVFWDGEHLHLTAWSYTGDLLWKKDIGSFKSDHGAGLSPIVVGDKVILNNDQEGLAEVQAYSTKTGDLAWSRARQAYRACYSTPFTLGKPDAPSELIVASTAGIASYNPKDGKDNWFWMWKFDRKGLRTVGSPIALDGVIYAASGDGGGDRHLVALKAGGQGKVTDSNVLWQKKKGTPYVPTMITDGKLIYWALDKEGTVVCVNPKTGAEIWNERLGGGPITASPILIDGKLYVVTDKGVVYVLKTGENFDVLGKSSINETCYATPAVADGHLFIRGDKNLFCIGK